MARKKEKPTTGWRALLTLLMALILPACATNPYSTYAEASQAYDETGDPVALEAVERYEQMVERAEKYFQLREACFANSGDNYIWACNGDERYNPKRPIQGVDALLRVYKRDRYNCGCTTRESLNRAISR